MEQKEGCVRWSNFSFSAINAQPGLSAAQILLIIMCMQSSTALGAWGHMLLPGYRGRRKAQKAEASCIAWRPSLLWLLAWLHVFLSVCCVADPSRCGWVMIIIGNTWARILLEHPPHGLSGEKADSSTHVPRSKFFVFFLWPSNTPVTII